MQRFIGYHFFHTVRKIAPAKAYSRTERAMMAFSDQEEPSGRAFVLDLRNDQGGPLEPLSRDLCERYGPADHIMQGIPVRGPRYRAYQWILNASQFSESFSLLESIHRETPLSRERTQVQAWWNFKFVDPETTTVLPGQEKLPVIDVRLGPGSSLSLSMGNKTRVNAWFLFPFESSSKEFEGYVSSFQKQMLFRFSPKHWRLWTFSREGEWRPKRFEPKLPAEKLMIPDFNS